MAVRPQSSGPFLRGVNATNQPLAQPKGIVARISNLVMTKRGALRTVDGSGVLHWYNGAVQSNRSYILASWYFAPIGVPSYYLVLAQCPTQPLGAPQNLAAAQGTAGGSLLANTTYYYKVTAADGIGGETTASNEASFSEGATVYKVNLTWNIVPNAAWYNIYRGTASGQETLLVGTTVPVYQVAEGTISVGFTDDGTSSSQTYSIVNGVSQGAPFGATKTAVIYTTTVTNNLVVGAGVLITGMANSLFNTSGPVTAISSPTSFMVFVPHNLRLGNTSAGGSVTVGTPPSSDTTQQVVLYKMPTLPTPTTPVSYTDAQIVALFPASPQSMTSLGAQGSGGGGGGPGGGGGTGGTGGGGGQGGRPVD